MTIKDNLQSQIFMAVLYIKQIMWEDLDMTKNVKEGEEIYATPKVVEVKEKMNNYELDLGYKPMKMIFDLPTITKPGLYTKSECKPDCAETLKDMIQGNCEIEELIKRLYFLSEDKKLK